MLCCLIRCKRFVNLLYEDRKYIGTSEWSYFGLDYDFEETTGRLYGWLLVVEQCLVDFVSTDIVDFYGFWMESLLKCS